MEFLKNDKVINEQSPVFMYHLQTITSVCMGENEKKIPQKATIDFDVLNKNCKNQHKNDNNNKNHNEHKLKIKLPKIKVNMSPKSPLRRKRSNSVGEGFKYYESYRYYAYKHDWENEETDFSEKIHKIKNFFTSSPTKIDEVKNFSFEKPKSPSSLDKPLTPVLQVGRQSPSFPRQNRQNSPLILERHHSPVLSNHSQNSSYNRSKSHSPKYDPQSPCLEEPKSSSSLDRTTSPSSMEVLKSLPPLDKKYYQNLDQNKQILDRPHAPSSFDRIKNNNNLLGFNKNLTPGELRKSRSTSDLPSAQEKTMNFVLTQRIAGGKYNSKNF